MRVVMVALLWGLTMLAAPTVVMAAVEARCTELGANCFCSEPSNTSSYPPFNTSWQNPGDTTVGDKECTLLPGSPGNAFEANSKNIFGSNSGPEITALPAGRSITWVARQPDTGGQMDFGTRGSLSAPSSGNGLKVRSMRVYIYWSTNYQFTLQGSCNNAKLVQANGGGQQTIYIKHIGGGPNFNDGHLLQWSPNFQDCCGGPWPNSLDPNSLKGFWWRMELHIINPAGGTNNAARMRLYMKNVTLNLPEVVITDTGTAAGGWQTSPNMTPGNAGGQDFFSGAFAHTFRSTGAQGACAGYNAWTHFMFAQWDTDTGQRIGAAQEIEGGGGSAPLPPGTPTNVQVTQVQGWIAWAWAWLAPRAAFAGVGR